MAEEKNSQLNLRGEPQVEALTKKEKLAFLGLVILAIFVVYLGFRQMGNNLKTPFALFALKYSSGGEVEQTANQQLAELKTKDTDKDGLLDYDELYIYNTSPYLPDSDSDGLTDKQEVDAGTDPNCPKGQSCYVSEIANATSGKLTTSTLEDYTGSLPSSDQMLLQNIFSANPNPQFLRNFLIQSGGDKTLLDKISDADLIKLFKDFITSPTSTLNTGTAGDLKSFNNLIGVATSTLDINNIDLKALREKLKANGVPEETLKKLDDKALLDLIKQM